MNSTLPESLSICAERAGLSPEALRPMADEIAVMDTPPELVRALERLLESCSTGSPIDPLVQRGLVRLGYAAPFLLRYAIRQGARMLEEVLPALDAEQGLRPFALYADPGAVPNMDEEALIRALRLWKYDNYLRITARDLLGLNSTERTCALISTLADGMIRTAYRYAFSQTALRRGLPLEPDGAPAAGLVLGMGKLGGEELNYSSDVDLIFVHAEAAAWCTIGGESLPPIDAAEAPGVYWSRWRGLATAASPAEGTVSSDEFHIQTARNAIRLLQQKTADGFGFRVDADLRPMGSSGLLSTPLGLLESYYHMQGREWERTAMIKARCVDGPAALWTRVQEIVRPFVYRRYLDYAALEGIALIKHDINRHHGEALDQNIKLGRGGIRENEFFVQALQLLYGGRNPDLQVTSHARALEQLQHSGVVSSGEGAQHLSDYWHLRALENRLQMVDEAQTQTIPADPGEQARVFHDFQGGFSGRLPRARGALAEVRQRVAERFAGLWRDVPGGKLTEATAWLDAVRGHVPASGQQAILGRIDALMTALMRTQAGERCVFKLARLLTRDDLYAQGTQQAFPRWLEIFEQIGNRNTLYSLIAANPSIVGWIGLIFTEGGHYAQQLIRHPEFLESFISLGGEGGGVTAIFAGILDRARDEEEFILDVQTAKAQLTLQILTAFLKGPESGEHRLQLSALAGATIDICSRFAWRGTVARLGLPQGAPDAETVHGFAVLAMGKLGSSDMHFGSDLDLVFLHEAEGTTGSGRSHFEFYNKLGQKLASLLTSPTQFGRLFELDHRLRPFGGKGLLVPSLAAYESFLGDAEIWNFQALTRIRFICGDRLLAAALRRVIGQTWRHRAVSATQVAAAAPRIVDSVEAMLERLVREHTPRPDGEPAIPLKFAVGGMIGFEFLHQCQALLALSESTSGKAWTPPEESEMIRALRPAYLTLAELDERISLHVPRYGHVAEAAHFESLRAVGSRWNVEDVRALARNLEQGVRAGFEELRR